MPIYTSFQFLQSIEDKLSEKVFSGNALAAFSFTMSRFLNFREEQATLKIAFMAKEDAAEEKKAGKKSEEAATPNEELTEAGKIEIQEVPHKGPASAFQCFITLPEQEAIPHNPMLITDDNILEREALKIALHYNYHLQESIKDQLKEDTFKPLSKAARQESITQKVDELVPRVTPKVQAKEDKKPESTETSEEAKAEAADVAEKEEAKAAS